MTKIDDGGPAFPTDGRIQHGTPYDGMAMRDWFAGQALAGICANSAWNDAFHASVFAPSAKAAYDMADAMIAARKAGA